MVLEMRATSLQDQNHRSGSKTVDSNIWTSPPLFPRIQLSLDLLPLGVLNLQSAAVSLTAALKTADYD